MGTRIRRNTEITIKVESLIVDVFSLYGDFITSFKNTLELNTDFTIKPDTDLRVFSMRLMESLYGEQSLRDSINEKNIVVNLKTDNPKYNVKFMVIANKWVGKR